MPLCIAYILSMHSRHVIQSIAIVYIMSEKKETNENSNDPRNTRLQVLKEYILLVGISN